MSKKNTLALVILDGWGHREDKKDNAIANAKTPTLDNLFKNYPNTLISASSGEVGLPQGQMGNSEVGHTNIGAGRIVYQDLTRITKSIDDGEFSQNPVINNTLRTTKENNKALHVLGLLSPGGVHSHEDHIIAMLETAIKHGIQKVYFHAFLDGRDTPPRSAESSLMKIEKLFNQLGSGRIVSLIGRYYAMDRDNNWDRVEEAYNLITQGKAHFITNSAVNGLHAAYERDENDEFVKATSIHDDLNPTVKVEDGDSIIFMNFRADRARQITQAFEPNFDGFKRVYFPKNLNFVMLTEYSASINFPVAFPSEKLINTFGEWASKQGKTQLRISETEKYAHVTFFFNGGVENEFNGESRILIPSPKVATYDLQPEMSSEELTNKLVKAIESQEFDYIICNYPNGDMVGHTGVYEAAVKAAEAVDSSLQKVVEAIEKINGQLLITADHGNAEMMVNPETGNIHTAHTNLPVPLIYFGNKKITFKEDGKLSDLAPTMLKLTNEEQPQEMTGKSLV